MERDFHSKIIYELASKIEGEKQRLVAERLKQYLNEDIDLVIEGQKMFPRIKRIVYAHDQSEHYFWNNGADEGLKLISFYPDDEMNPHNNENKITIGFKHD